MPNSGLKNIEQRKTPAQKRAVESIEKISAATKELLDAVGIDQISTNKIAEAAGISTGAIYNFFPNKEAILFSLVDGWLSDLREGYIEASSSPERYETPYAWIEQIVQRNEEIYDREPIIARHYNALTVLPDLRSRDTQHDADVSNVLAQTQQHFAPNLNILQAQANAMTIVQMIHGVISNSISQEKQFADKMRADLRFCVCCLVGKYLT